MAFNTTLSASHATQPGHLFGRALHACVDFFQRLQAAIHVAQAFESHRAPRAEDLNVLGIATDGRTPGIGQVSV